jgi:hypothetical protein
VFGEAERESFAKLKNLLCDNPISKLPDFDHEFHVSIDASKFGLGCMLSQNYEDKQHAIAYGSRILPQENIIIVLLN